MGYVMKNRGWLSDLMILIGCTTLIYGIGLFSIPAAWVAAGIIFILAGIMAGLEGRSK